MVDYSAGAGLYPCKTVRRTTRIRYRRFDTVAEALRFAIEDMPASMLQGSILEVDEARFGGPEIQRLYEAEAYPLKRRDPRESPRRPGRAGSNRATS
ncbi:hypothetical protein REJC140_00009 [Pseudorhizobium endolithicum]|uniref:Transposase n=1 Tax=Pseudorhizobium endolithicum TaxID=1191678 RepID=A0ABN7JBT7_9HYPH|nr:hypothetical protein REJC140_00009 [Pseudorhizobium endolithicum]